MKLPTIEKINQMTLDELLTEPLNLDRFDAEIKVALGSLSKTQVESLVNKSLNVTGVLIMSKFRDAGHCVVVAGEEVFFHPLMDDYLPVDALTRWFTDDLGMICVKTSVIDSPDAYTIVASLIAKRIMTADELWAELI